MIGGVERIFTPILFETLRAFSKKERAIRKLPEEEQEDAWAEHSYSVILAALRKHHPEVTVDDLKAVMTAPLFAALGAAARQVSGLDNPGGAGRPQGNTTGPSSTGG